MNTTVAQGVELAAQVMNTVPAPAAWVIFGTPATHLTSVHDRCRPTGKVQESPLLDVHYQAPARQATLRCLH